MNGQNFIKGVNAPDGIHDIVYFNEYKSPRWWSERRHRQRLINRLAPYALIVLTVAAFCIVGMLENA